MAVIPLIRQGVLGVTTLFSLIVLAISGHLISLAVQYYGSTVQITFGALGVAVGVISFLSLPVMLILDIIHRGGFTSMIVVELTWLSVLWILWVATAGDTVSRYNIYFPLGCDYRNDILNGACQEVQAVAAFSFLNFIIILVYTVFLCIMAVNAANRGGSVWMSSVKESFGSPPGTVQHPMTETARYNANPGAAPETTV